MENKDLNKILLVEDEDDIRTIAQIALEDLGKFSVKYCSSGKEALDSVEKFSPDLILLDVMMPGMDGITTMEHLRKKNTLKQIPIVFMTAKAQTKEIDHYMSLGAVGVITKPFDPVSLAENLKKIWSRING